MALGGHLALPDGAPVSNGGGLGRTERVTRRALDVVVTEELALHAREAEPRAADIAARVVAAAALDAVATAHRLVRRNPRRSM